MNGVKERNFDELAVAGREYQELDALERENDALWMENQNLRRAIQKFQILAIQAERDAEEAYTCMHLLLELLPKGAWRKKAQRVIGFLTQKQQRRFQKNGHLQPNQFHLFHPEVFGGYEEWGGYEYEDCRQKNSRNRRKRPLFRR